MFSWICPKCGREVSPSETECPTCKEREAAQAAAPPPPEPGLPGGAPPYQQAPPPPAYQAPPPPVYQAPPGPGPVPAYAARPRGGTRMPTWLLTLVFAFAFLGLGAGIYWGVGYLRNGAGASGPAPAATVESPAAKPGAKTSALQKYIEVSGIRFAEDAKKRIVVKFNLTNHSDADLTGLAGNVTIWGRTQKSEEDAVGTFSFTTDVGPQTTREVTAPLTTKLKVYELPDWQNVTSDLQITAPQ